VSVIEATKPYLSDKSWGSKKGYDEFHINDALSAM
jgi:hypothetical protein